MIASKPKQKQTRKGHKQKAVNPKAVATVSPEDRKAVELGLNPNQKFFCELFASDREFFGNGVQSYIEAYEPDMSKPNAYATVKAAASRLLADRRVLTYVNHLLELNGLNDVYVDKQLEFVVTQNADFKAKLGGISEYNKLKRRVGDGGGNNRTLVIMISGETAKRYVSTQETSDNSS